MGFALRITIALLVVLGVANHPAGSGDRLVLAGEAHLSQGAGWTTIWQDEFDGAGGSPPSARNWLYDLGRGYPGGPAGWGNDELQTYTAEPTNAALDGAGRLRLTVTRDAAGSWQSARIETRRADFQPPAGGSLMIEARLGLPTGGQGYWPAFWALGQPFRTGERAWPGAGEIDIMENINNTATIHSTLHCGVQGGGPCNEPSGRGGSVDLPAPAGFHTYALIWDRDPEHLRWQLDGATYATLTPAAIGRQAWLDTLGHGYFLLLNVAVGGNWAGPPDSNTTAGASMLVDYVRVSTRR